MQKISPNICVQLLPHGTIKSLWSDIIKHDGLVWVHFCLLEITAKHDFKHAAGYCENRLVALELLQKYGVCSLLSVSKDKK
jgi:hypothetical protein